MANARQLVQDFLRQFGLEELGDWAFRRYTELGGGDFAFRAIELEMPDQPAFQARFPAYRKLAERGRAMTPAQMLAYEQQAVALMRAAGLPAGFYDQPEDIARFLENEVSLVELQQRVQLAVDAVVGAPPEMRDALTRFYGETGWTDEDMVAALLDQERALPLVQQRVRSAQIGGAAAQQGITIERETAESLAEVGVTEQAAREGFGAIARSQGLFEATASERENIGTQEQVAGVFGTRPEAAERIRRRAARRRAAFEGGAGYGFGSEGVSGLAS